MKIEVVAENRETKKLGKFTFDNAKATFSLNDGEPSVIIENESVEWDWKEFKLKDIKELSIS